MCKSKSNNRYYLSIFYGRKRYVKNKSITTKLNFHHENFQVMKITANILWIVDVKDTYVKNKSVTTKLYFRHESF